ncbi:serpin B6-like [Physella acuta]|uniref:serpin B6-like n=1 Tax=Physella acuta TaxID=109671 RepID=UPI0027DE2C1B|nr:serpin B6-like [Physella acuta]
MEQPQVAAASNELGLTVLKHLYNKSKDGHLVFSPVALAATLTMTLAGSRTSTASLIAKTMHVPASGGDKVHEQFREYLTSLQSSCDRDEFCLGARVYVDNKWPVLEEFKSQLQNWYMEAPRNMDLKHEAGRSEINNWVAELTKGQVVDLLGPGAMEGDIRLVSGTYVKGKWDQQFPPQGTQPLPFIVAPGQSESVQTMCNTGRYPYIKDNELRFAAIEVPYKGKELGMIIFLPDEVFGLEVLMKNLTHAHVEKIIADLYMADCTINLILPKFELKSSLQLNAVMDDLGLSDLYNPQTVDLSGMSSRGLCLAGVDHASVIKLDEEGSPPVVTPANQSRTKTGKSVKSVKAGSSNILKVRVDHPFMFVVVDRRVKSYLSMGFLTNPTL